MAEDSTRLNDLRRLAERLAVPMGDLSLLDRALTHASATGELPTNRADYESLEFLGDAVLGLAVAQWLYRQLPDRTPGEYTTMRARVVNRKALAAVADRLGIAPTIKLGRGEEAAGGRTRKALLADCMEAIIGAVHLDCGWQSTQDFIERIFSTELEEAQHSDTIWDYRSRLQNYCQAHQLPLPEFTVTQETGPDHKKEFDVTVRLEGEVVGQGTGSTKKEAEQQAAQAALKSKGQLLG